MSDLQSPQTYYVKVIYEDNLVFRLRNIKVVNTNISLLFRMFIFFISMNDSEILEIFIPDA
jgi:hypothetical protein